MEKQVLEAVAKVIDADDKEMRAWGRHIFIFNKPTDYDIDALNNMRGKEPITFTRFNQQADEIIKSASNIADIF